MHFFHPEIHSLRAPGGKAVSEFPLINYSVAALWKIFGEHDFIYKLLEYFIYLIAIFILFNTFLKYHGLRVVSFFMITVLLTSPLLTYYSYNFLSDVPALSFAIMAFCFLLSYHKTQCPKFFYFSLLAGTLAVLLKASALIPLVMLLFFFLIDVFNFNLVFKTVKSSRHKILPAISIFSALAIIYFWYNFAREYNTFNNGLFLLTIAPIWDMAMPDIIDNLKSLFGNLFPVFLNRPMLILFVITEIYIIFHFKKLDYFLKYSFIFSFIFFIGYLLFFFQVFTVHDYYLINLFIFPVISFFCALQIFFKNGVQSNQYINAVLIIIFIFNALFSAADYRLKMIEKDNLVAWYPFISDNEMEYFEYTRWDYKTTLEAYKNLRPTLHQLNINRNDVTICLASGGPNVALYLIDQKGYVLNTEQVINDSLSIKDLIAKNAKYLILNKQALKGENSFRIVESQLEPIYRKSQLEIFKIK